MKKHAGVAKILDRLVARARRACPELAVLSTQAKNAALLELAEELRAGAPAILRANALDVRAARQKGLPAAMIDRLSLDEKRLDALSRSVAEVASLPDPVGEVCESRERGGLRIRRERIPLGVVALIYEARPNVTIDAAALCFKSGNAAILRGGSEAFRSNKALSAAVSRVLKRRGLPEGAVQIFPIVDRQALISLLKRDDGIDVVIPRGGEGLMKFVREHSRIPVIKHDRGVCSLFVDASARRDESVAVVFNAKVQRPGVCNALETLYVHRDAAADFLPALGEKLRGAGVEIRGDAAVRKILPYAKTAKEADFAAEYLDLILAVKTVRDVDEAIGCVRKYGSHHTDGILTENPDNARKFTHALDSSCVTVNASTRFNDGGELGLGAEIGISTTKMHAYGPMGLRELTIPRFVVEGDYGVRR